MNLLKRSLIPLPGASSSKGTSRPIRVFQFNILNDFTSGASEKKGGFACPEHVLVWEQRREKILQEITRFEPDIICLEELDHYDWFEQQLQSVGFKGDYSPRPGKADGTAIFHRTSLFDSTEVAPVVYTGSSQVALIKALKLRSNSSPIIVAATHLKADKTTEGEETRHKQLTELLSHISKRLESQPSTPVILTGDFNAQPIACSYTPPTVYNYTLSHPIGFASAYAGLSNNKTEPSFTTWKVRVGDYKAGEAKMTIDYIMYSAKKFRCTHVLSLPSEADIGKTALPCEAYPSDHLAILAVLELL
eukprot:c6082_g1_i1.p1 GENE.c6082_g1_i1~~c6082_g1_i1.p1  ORF type:complete len:333 (+),score=51.20 c6082_g1_i1:86-1000(+)